MPVVVVKYGAKWCPACRNCVKPFKELQDKYSGKATFYDVDVDNPSKSLPDYVYAKSKKIRSMPTFCIYYRDEAVEVKGWNEEKMEKAIRKYLKKREENSHK